MIFDRYGNRIRVGDSVRFSRVVRKPEALQNAGIVVELAPGQVRPVRVLLDGMRAVMATEPDVLEVFVPDTVTPDFHTMVDRVKEWTQ